MSVIKQNWKLIKPMPRLAMNLINWILNDYFTYLAAGKR